MVTAIEPILVKKSTPTDELSIDTQIYNNKSEINSILGIWKMIVENCQNY